MIDGARVRRRSTLPLSLAVAVLVNGVALLILTRTGRGPIRQAVAPPMEFRLVRAAPREEIKPRPADMASAQTGGQLGARLHVPSAAASASPEQATQVAAPAMGPAGQEQTGGPVADLRRIFRANLGCSDPGGLGLTAEERARCMARLGSGARQAPAIPAPMDPGKRAWFDATHAAYAPTNPMDGDLAIPLGCKISFGGPKKKFRPPHSLKIPGLPCYVIPPRGVLTEESHVAPPEHVETR